MGEGEGGMLWENTIETCILSRVKQITSPGWMHETSARDWCTGKTQRDGMGREVGGGIGMGNTCKSMADSCQYMAKTTTICKVISLQLIKINGKKRSNEHLLFIFSRIFLTISWYLKFPLNYYSLPPLSPFGWGKAHDPKQLKQYLINLKIHKLWINKSTPR